ncbi:MAG: serine hydrolase [Calditrichia bacterium]
MQSYAEKGQSRKISSPFSGAVLVAKNGEIVFQKAYGFSNRIEKIENAVGTRFPIASITKQFTAMLVMQHVESGLLSLGDVISKHLDNFPAEYGDRISIHQLLSHTSGLPHYEGLIEIGVDEESFSTSVYTPDELADLVGKTHLLYQPGEGYAYSSLGYIILGSILEEVSGKSFSELLKFHITEPLKLHDTGFANNSFIKDSVAIGYRYVESEGIEWLFQKYGGTITPAPFRDQSNKYSTGGMHSTVGDLFRWSEAIRNGSLLSESNMKKMLSPNRDGYCYGWLHNWNDLIERNTSLRMITHGGALSGYRSSISLFDDGTTIIFLSNISPIRDQEFIYQLHRVANGLTKQHGLSGYPEWNSLEVFQENGGLKALDAYFSRLSDLCGYQVLPSDRSMMGIIFIHQDAGDTAGANLVMDRFFARKSLRPFFVNKMGYYFLEDNYLDLALRCFQKNALERPHAANSWDSLGDYYMAIENYSEALQNYSKAVEIAKVNGDVLFDLYQKNLQLARQKTTMPVVK